MEKVYYTDAELREQINELLKHKFRPGSLMKRLRDNKILALWEELDDRAARTITVHIP